MHLSSLTVSIALVASGCASFNPQPIDSTSSEPPMPGPIPEAMTS